MGVNEAGGKKVFGATAEIDGRGGTGRVAEADFFDLRIFDANPAELRRLEGIEEE